MASLAPLDPPVAHLIDAALEQARRLNEHVEGIALNADDWSALCASPRARFEISVTAHGKVYYRNIRIGADAAAGAGLLLLESWREIGLQEAISGAFSGARRSQLRLK